LGSEEKERRPSQTRLFECRLLGFQPLKMNFEVFVLPAIEVQGTGALEAILQGVFHTIIFNRSLYSKCCPREREMDIFEVSYAVSENKEVDKLVFEGIRSFLRKMDEGKTKTGCVCASAITMRII